MVSHIIATINLPAHPHAPICYQSFPLPDSFRSHARPRGHTLTRFLVLFRHRPSRLGCFARRRPEHETSLSGNPGSVGLPREREAGHVRVPHSGILSQEVMFKCKRCTRTSMNLQQMKWTWEAPTPRTKLSMRSSSIFAWVPQYLYRGVCGDLRISTFLGCVRMGCCISISMSSWTFAGTRILLVWTTRKLASLIIVVSWRVRYTSK